MAVERTNNFGPQWMLKFTPVPIAQLSLLTSADARAIATKPGVLRAQITRFGAASGGHLGNQVAEQIGGY